MKDIPSLPLLLSLWVSLLVPPGNAFSCYTDEFEIKPNYEFLEENFEECKTEETVCTVVVFDRNSKQFTKYGCNVEQDPDNIEKYCPSPDRAKRDIGSIKCEVDPSRNLKELDLGQQRVECISDKYRLVDGDGDRGNIYCFNGHAWDQREYDGHGHYKKKVRCVLKNEASVPSTLFKTHFRHGYFSTDSEGTSHPKPRDGRYHDDLYVNCAEGYRTVEEKTMLELKEGVEGEDGKYYLQGSVFHFKEDELAGLCEHDPGSYVLIDQLPQNMVVCEPENDTQLSVPIHVNFNVLFKCNVEEGYVPVGTDRTVHVDSWGTVMKFVPKAGDEDACLSVDGHELRSGDWSEILPKCERRMTLVSRPYTLGNNTKITIDGAEFSSPVTFSEDMDNILLECTDETFVPVNFNTPKSLTFVVGDEGQNGYISPYNIDTFDCEKNPKNHVIIDGGDDGDGDTDTNGTPLLRIDPSANILLMIDDDILAPGMAITTAVTVVCKDERYIPEGWDSPQILQFHSEEEEGEEGVAWVDDWRDYRCEEHPEKFFTVENLPQHVLLSQNGHHVKSGAKIEVEKGPLYIHCNDYSKVPGPTTETTKTWQSGTELKFRYDATNSRTVTEPSLNSLSPCVSKVCTYEDYESINFIPYLTDEDGYSYPASPGHVFKSGEKVILQCTDVKGHVDDVKLHSYHCDPSGRHFVKGSLLISCRQYDNCRVAYHCSESRCNNFAATKERVAALCASDAPECSSCVNLVVSKLIILISLAFFFCVTN